MPWKKLFAAAALLIVSTAAPATAEDRVYADAFGNLVIHSQAGFKRILVGQGHLADDYADLGVEQPRTAYLEERGGKLYLRRQARCRYGALVRGRSYMYGLPDGALPVLTGPCG